MVPFDSSFFVYSPAPKKVDVSANEKVFYFLLNRDILLSLLFQTYFGEFSAIALFTLEDSGVYNSSTILQNETFYLFIQPLFC